MSGTTAPEATRGGGPEAPTGPFVLSPGPHVHAAETTARIMWTVNAALAPAAVWGAFVFGWRAAITQMLGLDSTATVLEVRQYLVRDRSRVVYRTAPVDGSQGKELGFTLTGRLAERGSVPADADPGKGWVPLGRLFIATQKGAPAGFVIEGETQGYKNRIRFFVALDDSFRIAGVRVVEHEEDPGLGAEVATPWFQGQFVGRPASQLPALDVTRDPMPEDWRAALRERDRSDPGSWRVHYASLLAREGKRPIYAVTGATISSRALTNGVRAAVSHFQRRWELLSPFLGGPA